MRHPWVTLFGQFPMKSTAELKAGETQERHAGLVGGLTFLEVSRLVATMHACAPGCLLGRLRA